MEGSEQIGRMDVISLGDGRGKGGPGSRSSKGAGHCGHRAWGTVTDEPRGCERVGAGQGGAGQEAGMRRASESRLTYLNFGR